jgi:hypothetical protein
VVVFQDNTDNTAFQTDVNAGTFAVTVGSVSYTGTFTNPTTSTVTATTVTTTTVTTTGPPCSAGTYRSSSDPAVPGTCTTCPDGQYQAVASYDTSCNQYAACAAGAYRPAPTADKGVFDACVSCPAGEYKSETGTWDSTCSVWGVCTVNVQYQTAAPDADSNRECAALTTCTAAQYQTVEPTATSNRACSDLEVCDYPATQYEAVAPTSTTDRGCQAWAVACEQDVTFESVARGASNDRTCSDVTVCSDEQYMTGVPTLTSDTVCTAVTTCVEATHITVEPDASTYDHRFSVTEDTSDGGGVRTADNICELRVACNTCYQSTTETKYEHVCENYATTPFVLSYPAAHDGSGNDPTTATLAQWINGIGSLMQASLNDGPPSNPALYESFPAEGTQWNTVAPTIVDACPNYSTVGHADYEVCSGDRWAVKFAIMFREVGSDCNGERRGRRESALEPAANPAFSVVKEEAFTEISFESFLPLFANHPVASAEVLLARSRRFNFGTPTTCTFADGEELCEGETGCAPLCCMAGYGSYSGVCTGCGTITTNSGAWANEANDNGEWYSDTSTAKGTEGGCVEQAYCTASQYFTSTHTSTTQALAASGSNSRCKQLTSCLSSQQKLTAVAGTQYADTQCGDAVAFCATAVSGATEYWSNYLAADTGYLTDEWTVQPVCANLRDCTGTTYWSNKGTIGVHDVYGQYVEDRVCTERQTCDADNQYNSNALLTTGTNNGVDAICTALTTCEAGEYEAQAATATSDRVCVSASASCVSGEYELVALDETTNRVCQPIRGACDITVSYESAAATLTTNRVCTGLTECTVDVHYISTESTPTSDRVCSVLRECTSEESESVAPTETSDRVCA